MKRLEGESKTGIGQRLREVRGKRTVDEFSDTFGVHKSSIIRWEAETQYPNALVLFTICRTESISATWLLTGEGEKSRQYELDGRDLLRLATAAGRNAPAFGYCGGAGSAPGGEGYMVMFRMPGEIPIGDARRCGACSAGTETAHGERVVFCTMFQICVHKRGQCTGFVERKRVEDEAAARANRRRELQAVTPAFGYCAGCGEPCALDPDGYGLCATCEQTLGKGAVAWSAK